MTLLHRCQPQEGDIVCPSPRYLASIGKPELQRARGRLTLIEHEKNEVFAVVTWDHPGLPDFVNVEHLIRARDAVKTP